MLFYLSISREVLKKVMEHAKSEEDKRVIGVLTGNMENEILVIKDAIATDIEKNSKGVKIPSNSIAEIANSLLKRKVDGNLVGWYHTHPGYEISPSDTDKETQKSFQQFSPYTISMISDPDKDENKFFILEGPHHKVREIKGDFLHYFNKQEKPIPDFLRDRAKKSFEAKYAPPPPPPPPSEEEHLPILNKRQIYIMVSSLILIGVIVAAVMLWAIYTPVVSEEMPLIEHTPIEASTVGEEITLKVKVLGIQSIDNVTIYYEWSELSDPIPERASASIQYPWKEALMLLVEAEGDEYYYTIPSNEVLGDVDYFIVATDKEGRSVSTPISTIQVSNFEIEAQEESLKVYIGKSATTTITIISVYDFEYPVTLRTSDLPFGITANLQPTQITPPKGGSASSQLIITASSSPGTYRGEFELSIYGNSIGIERHAKIKIVVPNFEISVSPTSRSILKGEMATYNLKLSPIPEYTEKVRFTLSGLPSDEVSWEIILKESQISVGTETEFNLKITTTKQVDPGTYNIILTADGGGIKNQVNISLTIK